MLICRQLSISSYWYLFQFDTDFFEPITSSVPRIPCWLFSENRIWRIHASSSTDVMATCEKYIISWLSISILQCQHGRTRRLIRGPCQLGTSNHSTPNYSTRSSYPKRKKFYPPWVDIILECSNRLHVGREFPIVSFHEGSRKRLGVGGLSWPRDNFLLCVWVILRYLGYLAN